MVQDKSSTLGLKILATLAWAWVGAVLVFASTGMMVILGLIWFFLALSWFIALLHPLDIRTKARRLWWLAAGFAGALGLVISFSHLPLLARIALCESSLTRYANQVMLMDSRPQHEPVLVGLFVIDGEENDKGVVLMHTRDGFIYWEGIAYFPSDTSLPNETKHHFSHLYGSWYLFSTGSKS